MIFSSRTGDTRRFMSGNVWSRVASSLDAWTFGDGGIFIRDDFDKLTGWNLVQTNTTGRLTTNYNDSTGVSGVVGEHRLNIAGAANDVGSIALGDGNGGRFQIAGTGGKFLALEWRIRKSEIVTTVSGLFCGLAKPADQVAGFLVNSTGALIATADCIGLHVPMGTSAAIANIVYQATGQSMQTVKATAHTFVASEYMNFAMVFDPVNHVQTQRIQFFVNNVNVGSYVTDTQRNAATFPKGVTLTPFLIAKVGAGAATAAIDADGMAIAQAHS